MKISLTLCVAFLLPLAAAGDASALDLALPLGCRECPLELREACAWDHISTESDRDHWTTSWSVRTSLDPAILLGFVNEDLQRKGWRLSEDTSRSRSGWRFKDGDGRGWIGTATVEPGTRSGQVIVSVSVDRPIERARR